jgi:hypothetical protein
METKPEPRVEFAKRPSLAIAAVFGGTAIAIGGSAVVLGLGRDLTPTMQLWLTVLALGTGGLTSLTAAFFGTVLPSSVGGDRDETCTARSSPARPDADAVQSSV